MFCVCVCASPQKLHCEAKSVDAPFPRKFTYNMSDVLRSSGGGATGDTAKPDRQFASPTQVSSWAQSRDAPVSSNSTSEDPTNFDNLMLGTLAYYQYRGKSGKRKDKQSSVVFVDNPLNDSPEEVAVFPSAAQFERNL